ncbi:hypothetical protein Fmac_017376 [Flemingia macrophylla]|uniref:Uncharacterized protein n=1 Tax=Flemingia macrophylla TaxID=520843 RepID=A0ABD1M3U0_9FABA
MNPQNVGDVGGNVPTTSLHRTRRAPSKGVAKGKKTTNNFHQNRIIGDDEFSEAYKGYLEHNDGSDNVVAVKQFKVECPEGWGAFKIEKLENGSRDPKMIKNGEKSLPSLALAPQRQGIIEFRHPRILENVKF